MRNVKMVIIKKIVLVNAVISNISSIFCDAMVNPARPNMIENADMGKLPNLDRHFTVLSMLCKTRYGL